MVVSLFVDSFWRHELSLIISEVSSRNAELNGSVQKHFFVVCFSCGPPGLRIPSIETYSLAWIIKFKSEGVEIAFSSKFTKLVHVNESISQLMIRECSYYS